MSPARIVDWRKAQPADVVLVSGPEEYFASEAIHAVRDALRAKHPMLEINEIDASDYQSGHLINVASPSLFAEPRLILVSSVEKCTDAFIEDGKRYLESSAPDTTVVLRHTGSSVRGKALLEAVRASGNCTEILCPKTDKEPERLKFVQAQFASAKRQVTDGAVRALVQAFSKDIPELAQAVAQLLLDSSETITEEIVDRYYGGRVEADVFKVLDSALAGRAAEALQLLRHAMASGQEVISLNAGFASKIRQIARISADPRISPAAANMSPWQLNRTRQELQGWDDDGLGRVMQALADTDAAAKGAERHPELRLEQLLLLIASKGRTR
jgi:DNA polymerase-3 subunit delta